MEERFPFKDRNGEPLGVGMYVHVRRRSSLFPADSAFAWDEFAGLVTRADPDRKHGTILTIRTWSQGSWTGIERLARPDQCVGRRKPASMRQLEQDVVGAKLRAQEARRR
jgi:hypothetical protein